MAQSTDKTLKQLIINQMPRSVYNAKKAAGELDPEQVYLPDAAYDDSLGVTDAVPGKTIKVKTVQDGKPTEWEVADIYEKPTEGIPKTDLAQSVQTSLVKADTSISYDSQTLTEEQKLQARTNIGALDENIHTTEVDVKRTLNGIGTNLFYVRKGWLKPCPDDANDELINSYNTAVLFLNFTSLTVDSVKRHAKGAYTIYQQGLASATLQFTDNPLDVERYISWDITTNNNKTYLTYHHYGQNGFSETCRYCVEDDSYDNVRVVNALNTRQTDDNPNATANQFYLATNPTKDMHIATKQYVDIAKTEAQQLGLTAATPGQIIKVKTVQDGKPTEWEAVDMPSGGVQSDWNQNDETAADYVKNRPFYTGNPVETVLVEESTVTFAENHGLYMAEFPSTFEATVGETYKVSWDGTVYECTGVDAGDVPVIGNLSIAGGGPDTGEPFVIIKQRVETIAIATADTSASHTFSISGFAQEVVKIDAKYLPENVATKAEVEVAQTTANAAQTTADKNKEMLSEMFTSVVAFTFDKQTSGRDTFVFNAFNYYKISDFNPVPEDVISFKGTRESGGEVSEITIGSNCVGYGLFIVVASAGRCSLAVAETVTYSFTAPSAGLYARYDEGNTTMTAGTGQFTLRASTGRLPIAGLLLKSSTPNSTKKFKITVDDSGAISATEVS